MNSVIIRFRVIPDNGEPYVVVAGARDVTWWEKTTPGAAMAQLSQGLKLSDLYKIAWIAARRQSMFAGDLKEFEATCELEFEEAPEPDPTQPAP